MNSTKYSWFGQSRRKWHWSLAPVRPFWSATTAQDLLCPTLAIWPLILTRVRSSSCRRPPKKPSKEKRIDWVDLKVKVILKKCTETEPTGERIWSLLVSWLEWYFECLQLKTDRTCHRIRIIRPESWVTTHECRSEIYLFWLLFNCLYNLLTLCDILSDEILFYMQLNQFIQRTDNSLSIFE